MLDAARRSGRRPSLGTTDATQLVDLHSCLVTRLPTARRIVLAGTEPGCGVSTVAAVITSLLGVVRSAPLLTVDASAHSDHVRLDVLLAGDPWPALTLQRFVSDGAPANAADAHQRLIRIGHHSWLLPQSTAAPGPVLDAETIERAISPIEDRFDLTILDLGRATTRELAAGRLANLLPSADVVGLVVGADAAASTRVLLDAQAGRDPGSWAARTILVTNQVRPGRRLGPGREQLTLRHDPALRSTSTVPSDLKAGTRASAVRIAAALLRRAATTTRGAAAGGNGDEAGAAVVRPTTALESGWSMAGCNS
ncbi:hypothetical protein [Jatrophihabitans sp. GAS493]|uniref:hypothetical protein n=1 Tax=Jatrophihabitans sp. GAS493 TaxID=1907575 RepID=UPI00155FD2A7|nr:hypothetical protein [Jatrophihabitans sp. GAS493]